MPLIQVQLIENVFTPRQKTEMIEKLTEAMVSIEGENMRGVTCVTIDEVKSGSWGMGIWRKSPRKLPSASNMAAVLW